MASSAPTKKTLRLMRPPYKAAASITTLARPRRHRILDADLVDRLAEDPRAHRADQEQRTGDDHHGARLPRGLDRDIGVGDHLDMGCAETRAQHLGLERTRRRRP